MATSIESIREKYLGRYNKEASTQDASFDDDRQRKFEEIRSKYLPADGGLSDYQRQIATYQQEHQPSDPLRDLAYGTPNFNLFTPADRLKNEQTLQDLGTLRSALRTGQNIRNYNNYMTLANSDDFANYSDYRTTKKYNVGPDGNQDGTYRYTSTLNERINKNPDVQVGYDNIAEMKYQNLNDDEIKVFNYLYNKEGYDAAKAFLDSFDDELEKRTRANVESHYAEQAKNEGVLSTIGRNVLESPLKVAGVAGNVINKAITGSIDQNAWYNAPSYISRARDAAVMEDMSPAGQFAYQTAESMGNFLFNTLVTKGLGSVMGLSAAASENLALTLMSSQAANDTFVELKDQGYSDSDVMKLAAISGFAEYITEKVSLEALMNMESLHSGKLAYIAKNFFAEGSEEVASDMINLLGDIMVMKDKSQWEQSIRNYMDQGASRAEAFGLAVKDQAKQTGLSFLGGALSGGIMGAGAVGISNIGAISQGIDFKQNNDTDALMQLAQQGQYNDVNSAAYRSSARLQNTLEQGRTPSALQVGNVLQYQAQANAEQDISNRILSDAIQNINEDQNITTEDAKAIRENQVALQELRSVTPDMKTTFEGINEAVKNYVNTYEGAIESENKQFDRNLTGQGITTNEARQASRRALGVDVEIESANRIASTVENNTPELANLIRFGYNDIVNSSAFQSTPGADFAEAMVKAYNLGTEGKSAIELTQGLSQNAAGYISQAQKMGVRDAEGGINGRTEETGSVYGGRDERVSDLGTGRQAEEVRSEIIRLSKGSDRGAEAAVLRSYVTSVAKVTPASGQQLGISTASTNATMRVLPETGWNPQMKKLAEFVRSSGIDFVPFVGTIELQEGSTARGAWTSNGKLFVQVDHAKLTPGKIALHEMFHEVSDRVGTEAMHEKVRREILKKYNNDTTKLQALTDAYAKEYAKYNMSAEDIFEEILADAYAGIDIFDYVKAEHISAKEITDVVSNVVSRETEANKKRGPPATVTQDLERKGVEIIDDSATKYSYDTWTETDKKVILSSLIKSGFSKAETQQWIDDVNSIAAIIAADRYRLDYDAADNQVMLKNNDEYVKTLDASTLCAKRLLYQGTFNRITELLPNTILMPDDLIHIRKVMADLGDTVPCGICYVESRRKTLSKFAGQWLNEVYKGHIKVTMNDLTSTDGLEKLRKKHPGIYDDYTSWMRRRGTANPKIVELRTAYRGDIAKLTKGQIDKITRIGGLRVQSFSDFETVHLIDMMQAVLDMSAKKLTSQAYTKVPNFAWAFGDTGIKINLSLIGKAENGKLVFDPKEGMPIEDAMKLRDRYSDNVGTILVGANDESILLAMADDRIDFIIPFHRSGWSKDQFEALGLSGYDDYQNYQNERNLDGSSIKEGNLYPIDYWDYSKTGKENAERYLEICKEQKRIPKFEKFLVDNGDGSWSLQPDGSTDGYWKMLIDFKMYNNEGIGVPQRTVTPTFNMAECERILNEYNGEGNRSLPVDEKAAQQFVKEYKAEHKDITRFSRSTAPEFYSKLEREVAAFKGDKIGAASVISYLKGKGVKDEEIKWTGIATFLEGKKSVSKADLLQYIRDNQIQIEEQLLDRDYDPNNYSDYDNAQDEALQSAMKILRDRGEHPRYADISVDYDADDGFTAYYKGEKVYNFDPEKMRIRWGDYKTPGGENYREILYKIPGSTYDNQSMKVHWGEKGVLAHARIQDFETGDGKILFVDEIQSDWHNAGEKGGYAESENELARRRSELEQQLETLNKEYNDLKAPVTYKEWQEAEAMANVFSSGVYGKVLSEFREYYDTHGLKDIPGNEWVIEGDLRERMLKAGEEYQRLTGEAEKKRIAYRDWDTKRGEIAVQIRQTRRKLDTLRSGNTSVPDAPFRNGTYIQYVLKDLLRKAAEGGYDYLAWTTGKMQEERWSDAYAEGYRIEYDQDIPKFLSKYGKQWGAKLTQLPLVENAAEIAEYKEDFDEFFHLMMDYEPDVGYDELANGLGLLSDGLPFDEEDYAEHGETVKRIEELAYRLDTAYNNGEITVDDLIDGITGDVPAIPITDAMRESVLYEGQSRFSRVTDPEEIKRLNSEKTVKVYRAMQLIDGKLYPPMAAKVVDETGKNNLVEPTELGAWYRSDERPDLIKDGKFKLDKANGSSIYAAYNPYWHTSRSMLNDQFSSAYKRPNLVTVECEVPETELTSGYKAEFAKDAVGEMQWHSGPVSSKLAKEGNPRRVILSRWVKVNRIIPDSEVAVSIAEMLKGTDIAIPEKTVTPSLKEELIKQGVNIEYDFGVTQKDIDEFVDRAYTKTNDEDYKKYLKVSDRLAEDVGKDIADIKEYTHAIRDNDIRHVKIRHGEATNEKYPIKSSDQKAIPDIVENYDKVIVKERKGEPGIVYVKVMGENLVYYLEAVMENYNNEKLLSNKQMVKTGINDIPNLSGLKDAIQKKQSLADFLSDLNNIREAYAQSANQAGTASANNIQQEADSVKNNFSRAPLPENADEEAAKVVDNLYRRASYNNMSMKYGNYNAAAYTDKRIEQEISYSYAEGSRNKDYARAYIAFVKPEDFIRATSSSIWRDQLYAEVKGKAKEEGRTSMLNLDALTNESQSMYLRIKTDENGRAVIDGHEGRHRMIGLEAEGYKYVPVIIEPREYGYPDGQSRYHTKPISSLYLEGQKFYEGHGTGFFAHDILPLSANYADIARDVFAGGNNVTKFSRDMDQMQILADNMRKQYAAFQAETEKKYANLQAEVEKQKARAEHFKGETRLKLEKPGADRYQVSDSGLTKIEQRLKKEYSSDAAIRDDLRKLINDFLNGRVDYDGAFNMALYIGNNIVANSKELVSHDDEVYTKLKDYLRKTRISVSPNARSEIADYEAFRRRNLSRIRLTNDGIPVDVAYQELQSMFGKSYFPEVIDNQADQLIHIEDVLRTLTPVFENVYSSTSDAEMAVEACAMDIMGTLLNSDEIGKVAPTFADRQKRQREKAVAKAKAQTKSYYESRLESLRNSKDKRIQELKDSKQRHMDRKKDSEMRTKLLNIARRLQNRKLPAVQRQRLDELIGDLDTVAKSLTGKSIENLTTLRDWYEDRKKNDPDFLADPATEERISRLEKRHIKDMSQEEVLELTQVLQNIENELAYEKKLIDDAERRNTYQLAEAAIKDIRGTKGTKLGLAQKADGFFIMGALSGERAIRRMTGYVDTDPLYDLTLKLSEGQRNMIDFQRRAAHSVQRFTEDKAFVESITGKKAKPIRISGMMNGERVEVDITPAERISLYLHSKNDANLYHIEYGGITVPDFKLLTQGKIEEAYNESKAKTIKLRPSEVRAITAQMTNQERAFAEAISEYFNGMSQAEINAVSEKLKGYSLAQVENYFPIETNKNFLKRDYESLQMDGTIEGMGFLKERVQKASTPIMLREAQQTMNQSVRMTSKYVGLAIPVRNFGKVMKVDLVNWVDGEADLHQGTIKQAIDQKWGKTGNDYIEKLIADLQNPYHDEDAFGALANKITSNYAGAVLEMNAGVAIKQAASYPTAMAVVGAKPLIQALGDFSSVDVRKIEKYTPLLWYRSQGFSTTELGDMASGVSKNVPTFLKWIQYMDLATTKKLWRAAEIYVQQNERNLVTGTDDFYQEVARVYNRIIEETQPNYTVMQRPELLRSKNAITRALNMFKTQPYQNFGLLYDAVQNFKAKQTQYQTLRSPEAEFALKQARKGLSDAIVSQLLSALVFAIMQRLWDGFRGKSDKYKNDKGEKTLGSLAKGYALNILSTGFGMIPLGSVGLELIESATDKVSKALGGDAIFNQSFYGMDVPVIETLNGLMEGMGTVMETLAKTIHSAANGDDIDGWETVRKIYKASSEGFQAAGIPAQNVVNLGNAIAQNAAKVFGENRYMGNYVSLRIQGAANKQMYQNLYQAYQNDRAAYQELYDQMIADGYSETAIKNFFKKQ